MILFCLNIFCSLFYNITISKRYPIRRKLKLKSNLLYDLINFFFHKYRTFRTGNSPETASSAMNAQSNFMSITFGYTLLPRAMVRTFKLTALLRKHTLYDDIHFTSNRGSPSKIQLISLASDRENAMHYHVCFVIDDPRRSINFDYDSVT